MCAGSVLLTSPTGDLDSLQDAVIKALQQQPNSTPLQISHNVWPRHENPQLESKRRHSMKIAVSGCHCMPNMHSVVLASIA